MEQGKPLTPLMVQYNSIKSKYKNEVLFFRLGDFYEMFDDDAVEVSRLLNLTLTHRSDSKMCGIPYHAAKVYIARLLRLGKKIVICEQVPETIGGKGIAERKVTEIITPGTALESEYLDGKVNNFLAAFCVTPKGCGFAFIDVTTSAFMATSFPASSLAENFSKELSRVLPRELLLPSSLKNNESVQNALSFYTEMAVSYYPDWDFNLEFSYKKLCRQFSTSNLKSFSLIESSPEVVPAGFLLDYLEKTTNSKIPHIKEIKIFKDEQYLMIDDSSRRNLEIVSNLRDGSKNFSLFECVDFTKTAMGSRLLRSWLLYPLVDIKKINARLSNVEYFVNESLLREKLSFILSNILDIERLASRISMEKAHPKDLVALKQSLNEVFKIEKELSSSNIHFSDLSDAKMIAELIEKSILDEPSTQITDGGIIKPLWSEELDRLRKIHDNFDSILSDYEEEEKKNTGISNLKIKYTKAFGYYIEVSKGKLASVPSHFILRRALVNGDRYTTVRLQELEQELNHSGVQVLETERDLFLEIRGKLQNFVQYLINIAEEVAYIDCILSYSSAAVTHSWCKPNLLESGGFEIVKGRHPVVENHLPSGEFVPNDLELFSYTEEKPFFALITGPNMAGKSTFLRQTALISLLAQSGSFVPASQANLSLVDKIFCRVGASDNLAKGESTFLVEMNETARILRSATEKSLVIMDEVGRGTSTEDGLAIAWAVCEHLLDNVKSKTLFATHYHELTRLNHKFIKFLCMQVDESGGSVVFLRKVKEGSSQNSYGLHVARLAGLPEIVVNRAQKILDAIQDKTSENLEKISKVPETSSLKTQAGLFSDEEIILDEILSSSPDEIKPIDALQMISRWKKTLSGR